MALVMPSSTPDPFEEAISIKGLCRLYRFEWAVGYWIIVETADNNQPLNDNLKEELIKSEEYCKILNRPPM
jgi:hypothetical protein